MAQTTYDAVVKLAEQLSPAELRALVDHLQEVARQRELSFAEWKTLFDALQDDTPILHDISNRRSDWYDDDGR